MADNLKLQQDINKAIAERNKMLVEGEAAIQRQAKLYATLLDVMSGKKGSEAIDQMIQKLDAAKISMQQMAQGAQEASEKSSAAFNVTEKDIDRLFGSSKSLSAHMSSKFPKAFAVAAAAVSGFKQGIQNVLAAGKSLVSLTEGVVGGLFNITKSILSIPFKIFDGLIEKAQAGGGGNELAQAFEDVRKEFGSFKQDVAKNVIESARSMKGELSNTGLSVWKVFGNLADRLKYVTELAKGMGPSFHTLGTEIAKNSEAIGAYQKGLGLSAEEMGGIGERAMAMGTTLTDQLQDIANMSLQMGDAFGLSAKMISRDVGKMIKDVKNFGSLTVKEMTESVVYTRKLGIEVNKLLGLIDKFDTFEGAAESAAKLSQAFGVNVNAFEMMKEQDPSKRLAELKKQFELAGKSADNLSRQELKLLADATGLDEATAKLALSSKNQGASMDDIKKKSDAAQKKQLTQAETMQKLADAIERLVQSGGAQGFKGFFDAFLKGIGAGITSSPAFIKLMREIGMSLMKTFQIGRELGQWIVTNFPGVLEIFTNLSAIIQKVPSFFSDLSAQLKNFFSGDISMEKFFLNMKEAAERFLGGSGGFGEKILEGFKETFSKLAKIVAEGIKFVIPKLTEGLKRLTAFLRNPKEFLAAAEAGGKSGLGFMMEILKPIIEVVGDKKTWEPLWDAFKEFAPVLWEELKKVFFKILKAIPSGFWVGIAGIFFGPAVGKAFLSTGVNLLGGILKDTFVGAAKSAPSIAGTAAKTASGSGGMLSSFLGPLLGNPYVAAAAAVAALGVVGTGMSKGVEKFEKQVTEKLGGDKGAGKIGSAFAGIIQMFSFGVINDEAAGNMAKNIGEFSQTFDKQIQKIFGKGFAKDLKELIIGQIDSLIDIGDFFRSLFGGDFVGAGKALGNLLVDLFKQSLNQLKFVFLTLPEKIIDWLSEGVDALTKWLDGLFQEGSDISVIDTLKNGFDNLIEKFGPILSDIPGRLISLLLIKIPSIIVKLQTSITAFMSRMIASLLDSLEQSLSKHFHAFGDTINKYLVHPFTAAFKELGALIPFAGKYISNALDNLGKLIKSGGKEGTLASAFPDPSKGYADYKAQVKAAAAVAKTDNEKAIAAAQPDPAKVAGVAEGKKPELSGFLQTASITLEGVKNLKESLAKVKPEEVKKLKDSFEQTIKTFSDDAVLAKNVEKVTQISEAFAALDSISKSVKEFQTNITTGPTAAQLAASIESLNSLASAAADKIVSMHPISEADLANLVKAKTAFSELADVQNSAKELVKAVSTGGIEKSFKAIVDMVESVQQMNNAVKTMTDKPLEIKAHLQQLATKLGMGAQQTYQIKNNGIEIKLNLNVTMDAGKVEEVIVRRSDSRIRKTFEETGVKDTQSLNKSLGTPI
jgi:hypothetical protein